MAWKEELDTAFAEDANVPVNLKTLFRDNSIFSMNDEALEALLERILKANVKYDLEPYILAVSTELQKRRNEREQSANRYLAIVAIVVAIVSLLVQILDVFGKCK
jgi:hypothetical protein